MKTVVVGLLLAFLLFTPQGRFAGEMAFALGMTALFPPTAAEKAASEAEALRLWRDNVTRLKPLCAAQPHDNQFRSFDACELLKGNQDAITERLGRPD
jgi:hypothetical protein